MAQQGGREGVPTPQDGFSAVGEGLIDSVLPPESLLPLQIKLVPRKTMHVELRSHRSAEAGVGDEAKG